MPIAYHPGEPFSSIFTRHIVRTLVHPMFVGSMVMFVIFRLIVAAGMSSDGAKQLDTVLAYPASLIGTIFAFLIGFFVNNCFVRFMDNWRAAMVGWSRLNDLALQVYAYVPDRTQACDVLRLMNAANHLCYGDLSGQTQHMITVCQRRHLLTEVEATKLGTPGGPPPFYICACWALGKLADQTKPNPVDRMFVLAMDKSIIEWRQQTTLLPMIQMNPLPFPYYRNMVLLICVFELVVALKISLQGLPPTGLWPKVQEGTLDTLLFAAISLLCNSLFLTSTLLLMPWSAEEVDGDGPTVDLPAEYFVLLPWVGHRRLFSDFEAGSSIFLRPLAPEDQALADRFTQTDSWKMMRILHGAFRELAPPPPGADRRTETGAGLAASAASTDEEGARYKLME